MSLKTLFLLMGLVTSAMVGAVIYTKVLQSPSERGLTLGEQRAVDRMCDVRCTDRAAEFARKARDSKELEDLARQCVVDCRLRGGSPVSTP